MMPVMPDKEPSRVGRADALALAKRKYLAGDRLDIGQLAQELGVNRVTLHRWVGTRDALIVEVGRHSDLLSQPDGAFSRLHRAQMDLATLGQEATVFPSHHGGFMGGEFGYAGQPEAFATKLREVLNQR